MNAPRRTMAGTKPVLSEANVTGHYTVWLLTQARRPKRQNRGLASMAAIDVCGRLEGTNAVRHEAAARGQR